MRKKVAPGVWSLGGRRYLLQLWWTCRKTGAKRRAERVVKASSLSAARKQREALRAELAAQAAPRQRQRLAEYAVSWVASKHAVWKPSTARQAASVLDLHVLPVLGDHYIDAIEPADVVAWRDSMEGRPDSINSRLRLLRQLLADACQGLQIASPAARVPGVRRPLDERREYIPDAGEAAALLAWLRENRPQWYPLVELLALTGLRFGEATALRWSDVDLADAWIHVRRAHWQGIVDHPKSVTARRSVPLMPELAVTLGAHQSTTGRVGGAYVFLGRRGNLHRPSVLSKPMRAALDACGLGDRTVPAVKVWRKVHNNLLRQVTSEAVRQALIGHAGAEVGIRHYTRVEQDEMRAAAGAVLRLVRSE